MKRILLLLLSAFSPALCIAQLHDFNTVKKYVWDGTNWQDFQYEEYFYHHGSEYDSVFSKSIAPGQSASSQTKTIYVYNSDSLLELQEVYSRGSSSSPWNISSEVRYFYDQNNYLDSLANRYFINGQWQVTYANKYFQSTSAGYDSVLIYGQDNSGQLQFSLKTIIEYNSQGQPIHRYTSRYNINGQLFEKDGKTDLFYHGNGKEEYSIGYAWRNNNYVKVGTDSSFYDNQGYLKMIKLTRPQAPVFPMEYEYFYASNGQVDSIIDRETDPSTGNLVNFRKDVFDVSESFGVSEEDRFFLTHFPNPANSEIYFNGAEEVQGAQAEIYSLDGKKLVSKPLMGNRLDLRSKINAGQYLLLLREKGKVIYSSKLLLE